MRNKQELHQYIDNVRQALLDNPKGTVQSRYKGREGALLLAREMGYGLNDFDIEHVREVLQSGVFYQKLITDVYNKKVVVQSTFNNEAWQQIDLDKRQPSLTLEQVKSLSYGQEVYAIAEKVEKWRVNGKVKTWKRDKNRVQVPIKHGLYAHAYIDEYNFTQVSFNPPTIDRY